MPNRRSILFLVAALLVGSLAWFGWKQATRPWQPSLPELVTPEAGAKILRGPTVFFTPLARPCLEKTNPAFFPAGTRDALSPESRKLAQGGPDPRSFRELDRTVRFAEVWLVGDVSSYKALLDHLLTAKDFGIVYLDHTSIILRRDAPEDGWKPGDAATESNRFSDPRDRAYFLAQTAVRLTAIRRPDAATSWLQLAEKSSPDIADVWTAWSTQRMAKGDWDEALKYAERALAINPNSIPAIACKAQSLYAVKRFSEAHDWSKLLLAAAPDDPALLFYHAKLSHEAHAYDSEIAVLQRLISIAERANANVSGYRIYLAQAYIAKQNVDGAMDQVTLALLDTTLPKEQREFADELLTQIKKQTE